MGPRAAEIGPKVAEVGTSWSQVGPKLAPRSLQERKKAEPNEQRSGRDEHRDENCAIELQLGVRKVVLLDAEWCGSIFKKCVSCQGGDHFLQKNLKK